MAKEIVDFVGKWPVKTAVAPTTPKIEPRSSTLPKPIVNSSATKDASSPSTPSTPTSGSLSSYFSSFSFPFSYPTTAAAVKEDKELEDLESITDLVLCYANTDHRILMVSRGSFQAHPLDFLRPCAIPGAIEREDSEIVVLPREEEERVF